jgi:hypothetical protein
MARLRAGAPITYITKLSGSSPYITKVTNAANSVPSGLLASATAIISATYDQANATIYIRVYFPGIFATLSGFRMPLDKILGVFKIVST